MPRFDACIAFWLQLPADKRPREIVQRLKGLDFWNPSRRPGYNSPVFGRWISRCKLSAPPKPLLLCLPLERFFFFRLLSSCILALWMSRHDLTREIACCVFSAICSCSGSVSLSIAVEYHSRKQKIKNELEWFNSVLIFIFKYLFEKKIDREGETEKEIFCLVIHFPNGHDDLGWAQPKPGALNFIWISYMGYRGPILPRYIIIELDWKYSNWISNWHSNMRCWY